MNRCLLLIVLFFIAFPAAQLPAQSNDALEYQLAQLDSDKYVAKDDLVVFRFKSLLDQLSQTFVDDKEQIAHATYKVKTILEQHGIKESMLNMMEGINSVFYMKIKNQNYNEYLAAYTTLRIKGISHQDSIKGLQDIIKPISLNQEP